MSRNYIYDNVNASAQKVVYTFASPQTTTSSRANATSSSIFNIVNADDLIPMLPLENWGFKRYGITRAISLEDNYEDKSPFGNSKGTFEWLMGKDYNNTEALDSVIKAFTAVASNRDELYVLDTSSDGTVNPNNKVHATQNGAQKELNEINEELANQKLTNYCQTSIKKTAFVKSVDVTYCPAFLMQVLANMASKNGPTLGFDVKGKYATVKTKFVKAFALGIKDPHFQESYYLLAYNNFK